MKSQCSSALANAPLVLLPATEALLSMTGRLEPGMTPKCDAGTVLLNLLRTESESPETIARQRTAQIAEGFEAPFYNRSLNEPPERDSNQVPRQWNCDCQRRFDRAS